MNGKRAAFDAPNCGGEFSELRPGESRGTEFLNLGCPNWCHCDHRSFELNCN